MKKVVADALLGMAMAQLAIVAMATPLLEGMVVSWASDALVLLSIVEVAAALYLRRESEG